MRHRSQEANTRLLGWTVILAIKVVVVVGFHVWSVQNGHRGLAPVVIGGDDGVFYLKTAEQIARTGAFPQGLPSVWPSMIGWVMLQTGWSGTIPFKVPLFVASIGTAVLGVRLLRMLAADIYHRRPGAFAEVSVAGLLLLFPSTLWIASYSIYRDAIIYFLSLAAVYAVYRGLVRKEGRYLVVFAFLFVALISFRWYAAVAVGAGAALWALLSNGRAGDRWKRYAIAVLVGAAAVAIVVSSGKYGSVEGVLSSRDVYDYNQGGSNLGLSYTRSSMLLWPVIYVYTFATNLIGPLPNQITGITTVIGFVLEIPMLLFVLWRVARSRSRRSPAAQLLLWVVVVWFGLIAIYNDNVGTGLRLRVVGYQFLFILAVLDVAMTKAQARESRARAARARVAVSLHGRPQFPVGS